MSWAPRVAGLLIARSGFVVSGLVGSASATAQPPVIVLTDVTRQVGIDWVQIENNTMMGAGGAFLDFDGDGWLDVLLAGGDATPGLYRNTGATGRFRRIRPDPFPAPLGIEYMCTAVADMDNDGDPDVFFGRYGPNLLFRNDGGGRFTDVTTPELAMARYTFTTAAAFGDYDGDGNPDLYVGNYIAPGSSPPYHTPTPNVLFRGRGDGTFVDVTDPIVAGAGVALATAWTDFDADGDVDLWVANDFGATVEPNRVLRNDGRGPSGWSFVERSETLGADLAMYCMGIGVGDYDRDADLDYYFTNLGRNALLRNDGARFVDVTTATGTDLTWDPDTWPRLFATSWGTGFHDFDNDGWLDLYVSNGYIPADPALENGRHTRNTLFRHRGASLTYSEEPLRLDDGIGRGVAFADYDRDGDVDVLQVNVDGPPVLLRNDTPSTGHWVAAKLRGRLSNRDAIGTRVTLAVAGFASVREVRRNDSYQSSSAPALHFGLGAECAVRELAVVWPSGVAQRIHDLRADRFIGIVEPIVTIGEARVRTLALPGRRTLVLAAARLRHHGSAPVEVACAPQVRIGYGATAGDPGAGATLWTGRVRALRLPAGGARHVVGTLILPRGVRLPNPSNLDFVWVVADAAGGIDEAKRVVPSR